jgi:putative two-component system response regulator
MNKVLIVDDEKSIRITLSEFLKAEGYEVSVATDFDSAIQLCEKVDLDIVLTDIIMPRRTGIDLLQKIHDINANIPVIMMTGEPTLETSMEAVRCGAYDYLPKPINTKDLFLCLNRAIGFKKIADEKTQLEVENKNHLNNLERLVSERTLKLRQAMINTALATASMLDMRDPYTAGHQKRVGALAREIGLKMNYSEDQAEGLNLIGAIHDIGKITVPAEILTKPSKLSLYEYEIIKEHAQKGYEILSPFEMPWPVAEIVYQHHERLDGSGYPRNLTAADISIESRIIAVADVVEAMMSHRPYRPALGLDAALEEIEKNKKVKYDADIVDICVSLFREDHFELTQVDGRL